MTKNKTITDETLKKLPEDIMLFEIKQYFLSCKECDNIIKEEEVKERCDMCKACWCCSSDNTRKKYFEATLSLCDICLKKIMPTEPKRKRRQNIIPFNIFNS